MSEMKNDKVQRKLSQQTTTYIGLNDSETGSRNSRPKNTSPF